MSGLRRSGSGARTGAALLTVWDVDEDRIRQLGEGGCFELTDLTMRKGGEAGPYSRSHFSST
jgi:hypothetical protein